MCGGFLKPMDTRYKISDGKQRDTKTTLRLGDTEAEMVVVES